jgi:hypothetical protein
MLLVAALPARSMELWGGVCTSDRKMERHATCLGSFRVSGVSNMCFHTHMLRVIMRHAGDASDLRGCKRRAYSQSGGQDLISLSLGASC